MNSKLVMKWPEVRSTLQSSEGVSFSSPSSNVSPGACVRYELMIGIPQASPATRREMVRGIHSRLSVSSEVQGQELTLVFYSRFLGNYAQTVTREKVAGMEVVSLRGLLFWLLNSISSSFCKSPARPFFSAASNAFMVGP